ncbi:MAG: OmpA family protein [Spirochaetes bacterium]|nr:OmpA family protein [Spirochaetota bacterium]
MKTKTVILIIPVIIISIFSPLHASSAQSAFLSGGSAYYTGRAGAGVSSYGEDLSPVNPASMALVERFTVSLNYSSLNGSFIYPYLMSAYPTVYGVALLGFGYFSIDGNTEQSGYMFSLGMSKEITSKILFGLSFDGMYLDYLKKDYYFGIKPGIIYKFDYSASMKNGFGFFNPAIGLTSTIGYGTGKDADLNSVTLGYNFGFYQSRNYNIVFYNDLSVIEKYKKYPFKFGLEARIYNSYYLRAGAVVPAGYEFMTITGGAGYKFSRETYAAFINYAAAYSKEQGVSHFIGVTFEYGALDNESPLTSIIPDYTYISPNYDGVQDYTIFNISVRDKSRIAGWRLQIFDANNKIVKEFKMSDREIEDSITVSAFFKRLFSRNESLVVPEKILWDGFDNSGGELADGGYKYSFSAWDARDNIAPVKSGIITIINTPPVVNVKTDSLIFSPKGDRKDKLVINQNIKSSPDDKWKGEIKNSKGEVVALYEWSGASVPSKFIWDGLDSSGNAFPDGLYYYSISAADKAGNRASAEVREIILTNEKAIADIRFENEYVSYIRDNKPKVRFFLDLSSAKWLEKWEVAISDKNDKKVTGRISGEGVPPAYIDWDCQDTNGRLLDDGIYNVRLSALYSSGNNPVSFPKRIIFDSTKPALSISHEPKLFSPDGDGENDYLTMKMKAADNYGIDSWEINIFNESGILFKKFSGKGDAPKELLWDGRGTNGDIVESASDYSVKFTAVDFAGNVSETANDKIAVDILVVVTERGLKMRISNIEFAFGSSEIQNRGIQILDRVYQILEKYGNYNIVIEGHSDDIGDGEYNQKLSEKRALAVRDYLVKKGTDEKRLDYIGMGKKFPFYPNTNDENRRRNRRVEFLLIKKEDVDK